MEARESRALYIISVAAELAGVHAQTLRIYERKGLIEPQRTQGGSRRYSDRDIALLQRIQTLTNDGVSLAGVRKVLGLEDQLSRAQARIDQLQQALEASEQERSHALETARRELRRDLVPVPRAGVPDRRRTPFGP